jgi:hypothetical protein
MRRGRGLEHRRVAQNIFLETTNVEEGDLARQGRRKRKAAFLSIVSGRSRV